MQKEKVLIGLNIIGTIISVPLIALHFYSVFSFFDQGIGLHFALSHVAAGLVGFIPLIGTGVAVYSAVYVLSMPIWVVFFLCLPAIVFVGGILVVAVSSKKNTTE